MKRQFEEWLLKQGLAEKTKSGKSGTVATYINAINKICKEHFPKDFDKRNPDKSWKLLCEEIIPSIAKYQELSQKDYLLDRVCIWYLIDYFERVLNFIYKNWDDEKKEVDLYLFHNKKDYFIKSICLKDLAEYSRYFATLYFYHEFQFKEINPDPINEFKTIVEKIICNENIKDVRNAGFHIVYKQSGVKNKKSALNHFYNCFINPTLNKPLEEYPMIMAIKNRPAKLQFYAIAQEITGERPRQIKAKPPVNRMTAHCVLQEMDLVEIFDTNRKTIQKYLDAGICFNNPGDTDTTELRTYYSVDRSNQYLSDGYTPAKQIYTGVCYTCEGYDYWCTKHGITSTLKIGKAAFKQYVQEKKKIVKINNIKRHIDCPKICYFGEYERYYKPVFDDYASKQSWLIEVSQRKPYQRHR